MEQWHKPGILQRIFRKPLLISLIVAVTGMIGSLTASEILGNTICPSCWYIRLSMYPLVAILAVAWMRKDRQAFWYVIPFTTFGTITAIYQIIIQAGNFQFSYLFLLPWMGLIGFLLITLLAWLWKNQPRN